jgi:PEGA domain
MSVFLLILWSATSLNGVDSGSGSSMEIGDIGPFHGSNEHGLLLARARTQAGLRQLRRRRFAKAALDLRAGRDGLEDSFDRLAGIDEILQADLWLAEAELQAGHRAEAERAAESVACLAPDYHPAGSTQPEAVSRLLATARHRVNVGPHATLRVTSVVDGQGVILDGARRGVTPETFQLAPGRHFVMVETPLGAIPYRVDLDASSDLRVGLGHSAPEDEQPADMPGPQRRARRRPVLPHRP